MWGNVPPSSNDTGRRCAICLVNWPNLDLYKRCPACDQVTSVMNSLTNILTTAEAEIKTSYIKFEQYLEGEDPAIRDTRLETVTQEVNQRHIDRTAEIIAQKARFEAVISNAGYTESERQEIERLEGILKGREINGNEQESD